jgi:hypothetical protein
MRGKPSTPVADSCHRGAWNASGKRRWNGAPSSRANANSSERDEDDDNRTYITQDEVIELLRDMERYRQKIAAAASLFEGWLATITAPLPVGSVPPCLPTKARDRPRDDLWLHEIKHDGFRLIARKNGAQWAAKGTAAALVRAASSGWESASGILFMADCLHFHRPDGSRHPYNSGAPAVRLRSI